ncbi:MAG: hypothetical protein JKY02_11150 [Flavobacteriaceae bacterium]|nr:hypothetical protein [Flavobacteriaceae bacterium]
MTPILSSSQDNKVNNKLNKEYRSHLKGIYGKLSIDDYKSVMNSISKHTGVELKFNKKLYINFQQEGEHCILYGADKKSIKYVFSKIQSISKRVTKRYNTQRLLIYTKNSFFFKILKKRNKWKLDN